MKKDLHPRYEEVAVECSCGNQFKTRSTLGKPSLKIEVCGSCHPFYTGTQKLVDSQNRVSKFDERLKRLKKQNQQEAR